MYQTHTLFRKLTRAGYTEFKCYCYRINKRYSRFYTHTCKFAITTAKCPNENLITITGTNFVHNHSMFPKDIYMTLFFKSNIFHLKNIIQEQIRSLASEEKERDIPEMIEGINQDDHKPACMFTEQVLYTKQLRPLYILNEINARKDLHNDEIKILLKELGDSKNKELKKKYCNLVNKIKKEMLLKSS